MPRPVLAAVKERCGDARARGLGEMDFSAVCEVAK